jgi:hypothetical protein
MINNYEFSVNFAALLTVYFQQKENLNVSRFSLFVENTIRKQAAQRKFIFSSKIILPK